MAEKLGCKNRKPFGRAKEIADKLSRMIVISDFTDAINALQLLNFSQPLPPIFDDKDKLARSVLKIPKKLPTILGAESENHDFRSEERFNHKLSVDIRLYDSPANTVVYGYTENISTKGMKIKLSKPVKYQPHDMAMVTLPKLAAGGKIKFENQPYNVIDCIEGQDLRLNIHGRAGSHSGRKVLRHYIHENIEQVGPENNSGEIDGLSRILRNLFTHNVRSNYGIIARKGSTLYIRDLLCSEASDFIRLNSFKEDAFKDLLKSNSFRTEVAKRSAMINKDNPYDVLHIVVLSKQDELGIPCYVTQVVENIGSNKNLKEILSRLSDSGEIKVFRIKVTKKGRIFHKYLEEELVYLTRYASAKAARIEDRARETIGIIEISDVTDLVSHTSIQQDCRNHSVSTDTKPQVFQETHAVSGSYLNSYD